MIVRGQVGFDDLPFHRVRSYTFPVTTARITLYHLRTNNAYKQREVAYLTSITPTVPQKQDTVLATHGLK